MCFGAKSFKYFLPLKQLSINAIFSGHSHSLLFVFVFFPYTQNSTAERCMQPILLHRAGVAPLAFGSMVTISSGGDIFLEVCPVLRPIWTHHQGLRAVQPTCLLRFPCCGLSIWPGRSCLPTVLITMPNFSSHGNCFKSALKFERCIICHQSGSYFYFLQSLYFLSFCYWLVLPLVLNKRKVTSFGHQPRISISAFYVVKNNS